MSDNKYDQNKKPNQPGQPHQQPQRPGQPGQNQGGRPMDKNSGFDKSKEKPTDKKW